MLKILLGKTNEREITEDIQMISKQLNISSLDRDFSKNTGQQKLAHRPYPTGWNLPRIKISPWHFPMPIDAENAEPWMVEDSYWTLSADLLIDIVDSFRSDSLGLSSNFLENSLPQIHYQQHLDLYRCHHMLQPMEILI